MGAHLPEHTLHKGISFLLNPLGHGMARHVLLKGLPDVGEILLLLG